MEGLHPTQEILIDAVLSLAETRPIREIIVDDVLRFSGVSRGSLYHHFEDYNDLLDVAQVSFFAKLVDEAISSAMKTLRTAKTREEWLELDKAATRINNSGKGAKNESCVHTFLRTPSTPPR